MTFPLLKLSKIKEGSSKGGLEIVGKNFTIDSLFFQATFLIQLNGLPIYGKKDICNKSPGPVSAYSLHSTHPTHSKKEEKKMAQTFTGHKSNLIKELYTCQERLGERIITVPRYL